MDNIREVADHIYQIDTRQRMPHQVIVYFIRDRYPSIVETGPASAVPAILEALRYLGQEPQGLAYIFLTHIHLDHSGGTGYLLQHLPQVKVVAHPAGVRHLVDPAKLIEGTKGVFGESFPERFGSILPVSEERIQTVQDEETISLGERELKAIYSPGHAHHHVCFSETRSRGLFVGEALGNILPGTDFVLPPVAPPRFDFVGYIETLHKLRKLSPAILFYPHNGAHTEAEKRIRLAYDSLVKCFHIVAEAMKAGESPQQISWRFQDYIPAAAMQEMGFLFNIVLEQGINYLKEKGDFLERILREAKMA